MPIIPFYGSQYPELFAIERAAMDRPGHVLAALDRLLPKSGPILDIGAGDGFSARALASPRRSIVALEPNPAMPKGGSPPIWVLGEAEQLPFRHGVFAAAYATWAYFFPSSHPIAGAVAQTEQVVGEGGVLAIVNNAGGDEFCALSPRPITEPAEPFLDLGFAMEIIDTIFEFENLDQAQRLLSFYFGEQGRQGAAERLTFRVALYHKRVGTRRPVAGEPG